MSLQRASACTEARSNRMLRGVTGPGADGPAPHGFRFGG